MQSGLAMDCAMLAALVGIRIDNTYRGGIKMALLVRPFWPWTILECHFEAILGNFLAILGHLRAMSGPSWAISGRLRAILGHLRAIFGHLGAVLRPSWGILAETGFVYERSEGLAEHNSH